MQWSNGPIRGTTTSTSSSVLQKRKFDNNNNRNNSNGRSSSSSITSLTSSSSSSSTSSTSRGELSPRPRPMGRRDYESSSHSSLGSSTRDRDYLRNSQSSRGQQGGDDRDRDHHKHFSSSNSGGRDLRDSSSSSSAYQPLHRLNGSGREGSPHRSNGGELHSGVRDRERERERERPRGNGDERRGDDRYEYQRDRERERDRFAGRESGRSPRERERRRSSRERERERDRRRSRERRDSRDRRDGYYRRSPARRDDGRRSSYGRRPYRSGRDRHGRYDSRYDGHERRRQRSRTPSPSRRRGREEGYKRKGSPSVSSARSVSSKSRSRSSSSPARSNSLDDRDGHIKIAPAQSLTSRYTVRRILGEGTFGKVLDCWDSKIGKNVALKVVRAVEKYKDAAMIEIDILEKLQKYGCEGKDMCIALLDWFEHRNHVVMSFERFGLSLYDFIKQNHYQGFSIDHVADLGYQLIKAIAFMHDLTLIHTDLKPENILLVNSEWDEVPITDVEASRRSRSRSRSSSRSPREPLRTKRVPRNTAIKVIDFGSATFDSHHHTRVISTRHYRAPEVILGLGWTYPADIWSIGCILIELLTGDALFVTHDNLEHLAMMERVFGPIPARMASGADRRKAQKFFSGTKLRWPELARERVKHGTRYVDRMRPLSDILAAYPDFLNLVQQLLEYEPDQRITARDALQHHFFDRVRGKYGDMGEKPDPFVIETIVATDSEDESESEDEEERRRRRDGNKRKKQKRSEKSGSRRERAGRSADAVAKRRTVPPLESSVPF